MNKPVDTIKQFAKHFFSLNLNIILSSNEINYFNFDENNIFKSPSHPYSHLKKVRQSKEELKMLNYESSIGVGIALGFNNVYAIDIDGCIDANILKLICKLLNLPEDYKWITRSGSLAGFHIIFQCNNYSRLKINSNFLFQEKYTKYSIMANEFNEEFGNDEINAYYPFPERRWFTKIEFVWSGNLMLPPSLHKSGNKYSFLYGIPQNHPSNINFVDLCKVRSFLGKAECINSTEKHYDDTDTYINGSIIWVYAKNDKEKHLLSPAKRHTNKILISFSEIKIIDVLFENNNTFLTQINWLVLNSEGDVIKRDGGSFFSTKLLFSESYNGEMDYLVASKIIQLKKAVVQSLAFDITYANDVYLATDRHKRPLYQLIDEINLGLDMFLKPGEKFTANNSEKFKQFHYMNDTNISEEYVQTLSKFEKLYFQKWKKEKMWGDFGSHSSVYDLFCFYHCEKLISSDLYIDDDNNGDLSNPPHFLACTLEDYDKYSDQTDEGFNYDNYENDNDTSSYEKYGGAYGFDDDAIDNAFEGDPENYWNVD